MIDTLDGASRLGLRSKLEPVLGSAFQPTGFPDLGAAEFDRPVRRDGELVLERALVVESVQSMANHVEALGWDAAARTPRGHLTRLPHVEVRSPDDDFLSSSRLEPHRLAGAYIKDAEIDGEEVAGWMIERFGVAKDAPVDWPSVHAAIFELDPLCLVHGVFFSDPKWSAFGNPKVRRALSCVVEAHGIQPAVSGGVKRDDVRPEVGEGRGTAEGYGFVPFGRTEYTAAEIELSATIDLAQIRGYGLSETRTRLLVLVALWELATLLSEPFRPRTACDLDVVDTAILRPEGFELPDADALAAEIEQLDPEAEQEGARAVVWKP